MMVRAAPTFLGSNSRCLHFLLLWACICPLAAAAESTAGGAGAQNSHGPGSAARVLAHTQLHAPQISSQLQGQQQQHPQVGLISLCQAAEHILSNYSCSPTQEACRSEHMHLVALSLGACHGCVAILRHRATPHTTVVHVSSRVTGAAAAAAAPAAVFADGGSRRQHGSEPASAS
jgi:hypothetical protein